MGLWVCGSKFQISVASRLAIFFNECLDVFDGKLFLGVFEIKIKIPKMLRLKWLAGGVSCPILFSSLLKRNYSLRPKPSL